MAIDEVEDDGPGPIETAASSRPVDGNNRDTSSGPKVQQPKPQALPSRSGPSSILVSPRQKGNPILNNVKTVPWEYSDIPSDYVLGATTCALFLSLKYHRLHPEYIYNRIQKLKGMYNLRILLTMVDISNHEEPLKELSKTSIINNVTIILTWSAQEAGRYLELFKTYEHAAPTSIKAHQSTSYSDKLVDFITVPRSINKTDAIGLVSNFGSIRTAVNAQPEEISMIAGWGEKKVQRWCNSVREPFRLRKATRRHLGAEDSRPSLSRDTTRTDRTPALSRHTTQPAVDDNQNVAEMPSTSKVAPRLMINSNEQAISESAEAGPVNQPVAREESVPSPADMHTKQQIQPTVPAKRKPAPDDDLSEGVMAALAKLRHKS